MRNKTKVIVLALLIIFWMAFIFNMSAKNANQSSNISHGFIYNILSIVSDVFANLSYESQDNIVENLQFVVRKGAHFIAYAILGVLCYLEARCFDVKVKICVLIAFFTSVAYAISDEIHQYFIPGRSCELRDVIIDSLGALFGIFVVLGFSLLFKCVKKRYVLMKKK